MRFVIYRNSILASICSLFGSACVAMAVGGLIGKEIEILPGIAMIAVGIGLVWLGSVISERKARKKQAKAQAAAAGKTAQPVQKTAARVSAAPAKPAKKAATFANLCFLFAAIVGVWAFYTYGSWMKARATGAAYAAGTVGFDRLSVIIVMEAVVYAILWITCFGMKKRQEPSAMQAVGFFGLTAINAVLAVSYYQDYGFGGYTSASGIYHAIISVPLLKIAAFVLMAIFAICAMPKARVRCGGVVRALWFVPAVLLGLACAKNISDSFLPELLPHVFAEGVGLTLRPEYVDILCQVFSTLAVAFAGFCYQRISRRGGPVVKQQAKVQPEPQYVQPQSAPVQAAPVYTAPVKQAPAAAQPSRQEMEKKLQAYKDLLDCDILTQAEYDEKVRELMRD